MSEEAFDVVGVPGLVVQHRGFPMSERVEAYACYAGVLELVCDASAGACEGAFEPVDGAVAEDSLRVVGQGFQHSDEFLADFPHSCVAVFLWVVERYYPAFNVKVYPFQPFRLA